MQFSSLLRKARQNRRAFFLLPIFFVLSACRSYLLMDPAQDARDMVSDHHWVETRFSGSPFGIIGFHPPVTARPETLDVYIESDGFA